MRYVLLKKHQKSWVINSGTMFLMLKLKYFLEEDAKALNFIYSYPGALLDYLYMIYSSKNIYIYTCYFWLIRQASNFHSMCHV